MGYDGTANDLREVIAWLEGTNDGRWEDFTDLAWRILVTVGAAANPKRGTGKSARGDPKMWMALPNVTELVSAMKAHDRPRALESARAALVELT